MPGFCDNLAFHLHDICLQMKHYWNVATGNWYVIQGVELGYPCPPSPVPCRVTLGYCDRTVSGASVLNCVKKVRNVPDRFTSCKPVSPHYSSYISQFGKDIGTSLSLATRSFDLSC